jgi:diguanylate cyclase (GGDEF)-like protein/PAS domain S-box-containing protein
MSISPLLRMLFLPAIRMTNRLGYTGKFVLLGLMSVVAMAVVVYSLYSSLDQVVHSSQRELAGRALLPYVSNTIRLLQQHRGRSAAILGGDSAMEKARAATAWETNAAFDAIYRHLPGRLIGNERFRLIVSGWESLRAEGMGWTAENNFASHTRLIGQMLLFMGTVADEYALTLDPDIDTYYLIDSTVIKLPMAIEQLGQLRAYGSGILAAKRVSTDQKVTVQTLIAGLANAQESLAFNLEKTGRYNPSIQGVLAASSREIGGSIDRVIQRVRSDILQEQFSLNPESFFALATEGIDTIYQLIDTTLAQTTDQLIQLRIARAQSALHGSLGIAAALFLLVVYFAVGIYLSILGSIQSLARSARAFADGDLQQRICLDTRDELTQVGESFNEMAQGLARLLVAQQENENLLRAIIGTALDAVVQMDHEGVITGWNAQAEHIFGWTSGEAMGRRLHETIIPERFRAAHLQGVAQYLSTGHGPILNSRIEVSALHRSGKEFLAELTVTAVMSQGQPAFCAFIRDITARKQAELLLQQSDLRFRTLFESSPDPVWIIENSRFIQCNQAAIAMLGYRHKDEVLGTHPAQLSPAKQPDGEDSYAKAERMMAIALEQGINRFEWMHRRADGSDFPAEVTLSAFSLEERPMIYCAWRDISERKQAEESMRLAALVYEHSSEAMTVTDANGIILAVNPAFTQVTGYTQDEVIGKNPKILSSGQHSAVFYQAMWQAINSGGQWQGEIRNRRKSGELYPEWLTINTIFAQDGSVHRRVALFTDISEKKASDELIWKQANFDFLTGLPNRRMFLDRLAQEMKQALRDHSLLVLMFLDLDHFKEVNDILGHARGDSLLQEVARRLVECVRDSDTVARLGGDEFTVILGRVKDISAIDPIAQSILRRLAAPFQLGQEVVHISASLGITLYPEDAGDVEALLKNADQAMYAAKNAGRNRYSYFTRLMQEAAQIRAQLATDLHSALAGEQFLVYYQPVVDLATGRIVKAEALIRWQNPRCGLVSPAAFIPIAEETGLIEAIGDWVFRTAVYQAAQWRATLLPDFQISVNKSPAQFRSRSDSGTAWLDYLHALGLPGDSVVVEITEGLLMEGNADKLQAFRDAGLQIALDDFGTGYSSLAYLQKYDIDYLKIDQSFVRNLAEGSNDMALCEAIIVMAHKLGINVIAEGVETSEQRDLLAAAGCDYGQGYLFARPIPAQEFEALLRAEDQEIKA